MKKWNIIAMAAVLAIATATFGGSYAAEKLKIGFIYTGPIGDLGWSYQHDVGRKAMEKALAGKVETTYLENVPEGPDAERSIEQLARTGHKLIFTTSFGFMDPTLKVANKYPNVFFEHATGFKRAKNMAPMPPASMKGATSRAKLQPRSRRRACSAISSRFRSPRSSPTSTRRCLARSRSTRT